MSIRELSKSDAEIVAGGAELFWFHFAEGTFWDWAVDIGKCVISAIPKIANGTVTLNLAAIATSCPALWEDIQRVASSDPNGTGSGGWTGGAWDVGGYMVTGFGLGDSFGGEPSI